MKNSIIFKITIIFLIATLSLIVLFINYIQIEKERNLIDIKKRYEDSCKVIFYMLESNIDKQKIKNLAKEFNFEVIEDKEKVLNCSTLIEKRVNKGCDKNFKKLIFKDNLYLYLMSKDILLKDLTPLKHKNRAIWFVFFGVLILLIFVYILLIRSIYPLKILNSKIRKFADGDMNIDYKIDGKDEISKVANEFSNAVDKIRDLIESRQMFLRMIMHELKTPITKGRLSAEMLEDGKQKSRIIKSFERVDNLINEFSKIEQLNSKNYNLNIKPYKFSHILENAIDKLMLDNIDNIFIDIDESSFEVDFETFSLAIKNLLDNGIKYSNDSKVYIECKNRVISISNSSKKIESFENYLKPFNPESNGLGLGFYIIKSILDVHNSLFEYEYRDKKSIFIIKA